MTTQPNPNDNPWAARLGLLALSHVAGTLNIVSVMAMAPAVTDDLGLTATAFGFFITAYYCAQALWSLPAGGFVDRYGVARVLVASHGVMAAAALIAATVRDYNALLAAFFLMGIGYSMTNPATARGVFDWFPEERRGTAMGIKQVGVPLGGVVAAGNGALAAYLPWQDLMLWVAGAIFLNGLLCLYLLRYPLGGGEAARPIANIRAVMKDANVDLYTVVNGMLNFGQTNFYAFLTLFLREAAGASQPVAGFAIGLAQTASAVARIGWGIVSDTAFAGRRKALMVLICLAAALFLSLMMAVGPGPGLWVGLALTLALGITIASFAPVAQAISVEMVEPRLAGSALGYNMVGVHIGGMAGPPLFGVVVDATGSYGDAWLLTAAVVGIGALAMGLWFREGQGGGR